MTKAVFIASLIDSSTNGNLGIGTNVVASSGNATVVVAGLGTNGGGLQLAGGTAGGIAIEGLNGGGVLFDTYTGAIGSETYTERMRITSAGQVGIGISTPSTIFHVATSTQGTDGIFVSGAGKGFLLAPNLGGANYNNIVSAGDNGIIYGTGSGADTGTLVIAPWASITGGIRMSATGNVGIGNSTVVTGYVLDVKGNINASGSIATTADSTQVATTAWVRDQGGFQTQIVYTSGTGASATLPAWANKVKVTVVGAGGAGGGNPATVGAPGSGGGSGAVSVKYFTGVAGLTYTYNVGVAGTGVSANNGIGGAASNIFISGQTIVNAPGGGGGTVGGAASTNIAGGAAGAAGTGGDFNLPGSAGGASQSTAAAGTCASGFGAPGFMGLGLAPSVIKTSAGSAAGNTGGANTGAGGSGSAPGAATATTGTGGNGAAGLIIIEY